MRNRQFLTVGFIILATSGVVCEGQITEEARLQPIRPITSDIFGYDVGFDGTTIVSGAPFGSFSGYALSGRAFVFEREYGEWKQAKKLLPSTMQDNAFFGVVVAIDAQTVAVAAPGEDLTTEDEGAVYVFEPVAGVWSEVQKLTAPDAVLDAAFGGSLAIQGDTMLVGAAGDSNAGGDYAGAVYVFERTGGVWNEVQKLTASDPAFDDNFGVSAALDGDVAVIGALDDDHSARLNPGAAYIFEKVGGVWTETAKLVASDASDEAEFGISVAIQGDTVVVAAQSHSHSGLNQAGGVYVYQRSGDQWPEVAKILAADAQAGDLFGTDVSLDGNTLLIGSYLDNNDGRVGSAYLYRFDGVSEWQYETEFVASDGSNTLFGWRLAHLGDQAVIAGPFYQTNRGAAYVVNGMLGVPRGDLNCDGTVDGFDIDAFVMVLLATPPYADYQALHPGCDPILGDLNRDGLINGFDIDPFVDLMLGE